MSNDYDLEKQTQLLKIVEQFVEHNQLYITDFPEYLSYRRGRRSKDTPPVSLKRKAFPFPIYTGTRVPTARQ